MKPKQPADLTRPCPTCGARPGHECVAISGGPMGRIVHAYRNPPTRARRRELDRRLMQPRKPRRRQS